MAMRNYEYIQNIFNAFFLMNKNVYMKKKKKPYPYPSISQLSISQSLNSYSRVLGWRQVGQVLRDYNEDKENRQIKAK